MVVTVFPSVVTVTNIVLKTGDLKQTAYLAGTT